MKLNSFVFLFVLLSLSVAPPHDQNPETSLEFYELSPSAKSEGVIQDQQSRPWQEVFLEQGQELVEWLSQGDSQSISDALPETGRGVLLLGLGSKDIQVPIKIAVDFLELVSKGVTPNVLFSGGVGRGTGGLMANFRAYLAEKREVFSDWVSEEEYVKKEKQYLLVDGEKVIPEAGVFEKIFRIELKHRWFINYKEIKVLVEPNSTNTGANIEETTVVLAREKIDISTVVLVTAPVLMKRAAHTLRQKFPNSHSVTLYVHPSNKTPLSQMDEKELVSTITLGLTEIPRIRDYQKEEKDGGPRNGPFMTPVAIPEQVEQSYRALKLASLELAYENAKKISTEKVDGMQQAEAVYHAL